MIKIKKHLGQNFLIQKNIAKKIVNNIPSNYLHNVLEVGPGKGILTQYIQQKAKKLFVVEIDKDLIPFLKKNFTNIEIINSDFLNFEINKYFKNEITIVGNFPYNISSQIIFKILKEHKKVPFVLGMFQKEMAKRLTAMPKTKDYGIITVLSSLYYDIKILFDISPGSFYPKPKVNSSVVRFIRKKYFSLPDDIKFFNHIVKTAFKQRRKMIRSSLKEYFKNTKKEIYDKFNNKRPEELNTNDWILLSKELLINFD